MQGLVTVFGGSGFVGTQVVRALAKRGWRVRAAVRRAHLAVHLRPMGDVGQIQIMTANVAMRETVDAAVDGADVVINLVGALYEAGRVRFDRVHAEGAKNVAEAAAAAGASRLVHVSALGADPKSPSKYARSKAEGEAAVRQAFPNATILRPSIIFGEGDGFFDRFASTLGYAPALPLFGGGATRFQPVYVADVAEAIARAVERTDAAGQTYEIGGPKAYTFKELLELIQRETGRKRPLVPLPMSAAGAIGAIGDVMASIGLPPVLTSDQAKLLRRDNVVSGRFPGLQDLGVQPTAVEPILPSYLWRYRRGGQFAQDPIDVRLAG